MKFLIPIFLWLSVVLPCLGQERQMLIVVSEPGDANYDTEFRRQAAAWQDLASRSGSKVTTLGLDEETAAGDLPKLEQTLASLPKEGGDLWLVLIGHGSFDGRTANFNLRGKDIEPAALKELLKPFNRRLVILNLFSASASFLPALAGENRVIICSGRSPGERNYSRFGEKFADSLTHLDDADLDLDGSLSLLEVTLHASAGTRAFYEDAQRILQEHATIDDNGDGKPTSTDRFKGLRAEPNAANQPAPDGPLAREISLLKPSAKSLPPAAIQQRADIEEAIEALRKSKPRIPENEYYDQLETLLRQLAKVYGN